MIERYAKDMVHDPFYVMIERRKNWIKLTFLSWTAFFILAFAAAVLMGSPLTGAIQFGASLFIWAGALRTVLVWHTTWSVNSLSHIWGYRNYETADRSRSNPIVGFLAAGISDGGDLVFGVVGERLGCV